MDYRRLVCAAALCLLPVLPAVAKEDTALTIYSTATPGAIDPDIYMPGAGMNVHHRRNIPGYAIVKQERQIELPQQRSEIRFSDVAALIDPTTVSFVSLSNADTTSVLEQNFEFDLVSAEKLMQRYIDKHVTVEQAHGDTVETHAGTLLSTDGAIILRNDEGGGVSVINGYSNVRFPELPGGLITRPTLVWDVVTEDPGSHDVRVTYETKGITWWADYNIEFMEGENANSGVLDIGAWVSIVNQSGATYENAGLKLIAGDVHRAPEPQAGRYRGALAMEAKSARMDMGFEEKSFFEYHLYTLGRPTTLPDHSTKQIELFPAARGVPCEKVLVYYGLPQGWRSFMPDPATDRNYGVQSNKKVDTYLRFQNEKEVGMGMPLPSGRIRVSQRDPADDTLEFIGEDTIDHTPKGEEVLIKLGSAFDVVGERKQVDFQVDHNRHWMEEEIEIVLRNHKEEPVTVVVKENLYRWVNWKITENSHEYVKSDARTIEFPVRIDKDGEAKVTYTVRYTW